MWRLAYNICAPPPAALFVGHIPRRYGQKRSRKMYTRLYTKRWKTGSTWLTWNTSAGDRKSSRMPYFQLLKAIGYFEPNPLITRRSEVRILPPLLDRPWRYRQGRFVALTLLRTSDFFTFRPLMPARFLSRCAHPLQPASSAMLRVPNPSGQKPMRCGRSPSNMPFARLK